MPNRKTPANGTASAGPPDQRPRPAPFRNPEEQPSRHQGAQPEPVGDLELNHDPDFQHLWWKVERAGWLVMAALVVGGLLGLFGSGPLSHSVVGDPFEQPIRLEYDRFGRLQKPTTLRAHLRPDAGQARVWLSRPYVEDHRIERVEPEPERIEAGPDRLVYVFRVVEPGRPTAVTFHLKPERPGTRVGHIGLGAGPPLRFQQFVYP